MQASRLGSFSSQGGSWRHSGTTRSQHKPFTFFVDKKDNQEAVVLEWVGGKRTIIDQVELAALAVSRAIQCVIGGFARDNR